MKQGEKKRLAPKPKTEKASWKKRNAARECKQTTYAEAVATKRASDVAAATENAS